MKLKIWKLRCTEPVLHGIQIFYMRIDMAKGCLLTLEGEGLRDDEKSWSLSLQSRHTTNYEMVWD